MAKQAASQDGRLFGGNGFFPARRQAGLVQGAALAGCVFANGGWPAGIRKYCARHWKKDGAGNGGGGGNTEGQGSGQTILHTRFDGDGPDFGFRQQATGRPDNPGTIPRL